MSRTNISFAYGFRTSTTNMPDGGIYCLCEMWKKALTTSDFISEPVRFAKSFMAAYAASRKRFEIEVIGLRTTWKVIVSDGVDSAQGKKNDVANMYLNSGYYFERRAYQQLKNLAFLPFSWI